MYALSKSPKTIADVAGVLYSVSPLNGCRMNADNVATEQSEEIGTDSEEAGTDNEESD